MVTLKESIFIILAMKQIPIGKTLRMHKWIWNKDIVFNLSKYSLIFCLFQTIK